MSTRNIVFSEGEFYHLYNRGVDKRIIFQDHNDYRRFLELLYVSNSSSATDFRAILRNHASIYDYERSELLVAIGAYCLMPNHFHILITPLVEQGVTKFMNKLATSYAMYFNKKYSRSGALYEGKFKARWANSDEYLKYLFSYIHLNPVALHQPDWKEKGIKDTSRALKYLDDYRFSSYLDYVGTLRDEAVILNRESAPDYFPSEELFKEEIFEWLSFDSFKAGP